MSLISELASRGVSRRDFLKFMGATAAALGISEAYVPQMVEAVSAAAKKPPVIWLEGQDCAGCTESTLATLNPSVAEILLDMISDRYHETIMGASGSMAEGVLAENIREGGYILVVEGSVPSADPRFCRIAGVPFVDHLRKAAENASLIVAAGSCATYGGGIVGSTPTRGVGVQKAVQTSVPVINLPNCPVKPTRLIGTLVYYLTFKKVPPLDHLRRPLMFYQYLHHDNCSRRGHYDAGQFLTDWNDPTQANYCLLLKGCKGPVTYTDCPRVWWNDGVSYCIAAGSPCAGCTEPAFYQGFSPLYQRQDNFALPGAEGVSAATAGEALLGLAAAGVVVHGVGRALGSKAKKQEGDSHGQSGR